MFLLLLACGTLYLILGDHEEAMMLLGFVFVVIGITYYQEKKTENALDALRDLSSPRALVRRDGEWVRIAGRDVARGDIQMLSEGDRVPADAVILSCTNLHIDESLLTGESVPVRKAEWDGVMEMARPGGEDLPFVYSATLVVSGQGVAEVRGTGLRTEIGKIGKALQTLETEKPPLQREINSLIRDMGLAGAAMSVVVTLVFGLTNGNNMLAWQRGILSGLAMAMGLLPEEFPVVLTIFMAMGAWRMSQNQVLTRRMPAIETLGSATVLCVDKTGTLDHEQDDRPQAGSRRRVHPHPGNRIAGSPAGVVPRAGRILGPGLRSRPLRSDGDAPSWTWARELSGGPSTCMRTGSSSASIRSHGSCSPCRTRGRCTLAMGGWLQRVHRKPSLTSVTCRQERQQLVMQQVLDMANDGLRVLGVARAVCNCVTLPESQHDFDFEFIGLIGLADPIRATVPAALHSATVLASASS